MPESMKPEAIHAWQMVGSGKLRHAVLPTPTLQPGEVLVKIAGCGVCHTDLSYFFGDVVTRQTPPLTLGHEISGVVMACADEGSPLLGKEVIVPAVLPCNDCELCATGRTNRCLNQKMPGNSLGIYGGFASHIPVPGADLCVIERRGQIPLAHLAVVADAVTTPYHAARRAGLGAGDRVVVIGAAGGVGRFMVQIARALGARAIVGIDIDTAGLAILRAHGLDGAIDARNLGAAQVKEAFKNFCATEELPHNYGWKIFEVSGSRPGQEIGLSLLSFVGKLVVIGYGTDDVSFMISKLMAYDAEIVGIWGCPPALYAEVLTMCVDGRIDLAPFVEARPMSRIEEVFVAARRGELTRRVVLVPDFRC